MEALIEEIEKLVPLELDPHHGWEMRYLMERYRKYKNKEIGPDELLSESKVVTDRTWEYLNIGKWMDVAVHHRQVYAIASLIQVLTLLRINKEDAIEKSLQVTDLGILLGHPFGEVSLTRVAELLSRNQTRSESRKRTPLADSDQSHWKKMKLYNEVPTRSKPALESFRNDFFRRREPAKLVDCMEHWPALTKWNDLGYIKSLAGQRTVPIEIGRHYADEGYRQRLMKISDFIDEYLQGTTTEIGYLAQHQLFDQVPELRKDIREPDYCAISETNEDSPETDVNAWFGPKGTVSPLHFDPKHNLLCQVVGTKKITLFPESDTPFLYPHEGMLLFNTSRVDVENPDFESYPEFRKAVKRECLLLPGQMLYIPPKYWHHVRALDNSFSVSFWWL